MRETSPRSVGGLAIGMLAIVATPYLLGLSAGGMFRIGPMLDPVDGLYRTARLADADPPSLAAVAGLGGPVEVAWDGRGVPHIFAENDLDAIRATGYVTAHDRLFQMDFLRRFTSGRLAEVFGPSALSTDRSMRRTGIEAAVRMNVEAARDEDRPTYELFAAFADGVNAYLSGVEERDLPFEFRLFGYRPEPFTALDPGLIGWNLLYDLTFRGTPTVDDAAVDSLLGPGVGDLLFPRDNPLSRPIVPAEEAHWWTGVDRSGAGGFAARIPWTGDERWTESFADLAAGLVEGKGSNNWAVGPRRSATGAPILAGDMHLALWLPSIWYELHVVTPTMDSYGVTVPGVPLPIEAFNRSVGWAFTNTGADQVDHLLLVEDSTGRRYRYDDGWRDFRFEVDTLLVRGGDSVVDTVRWTHWGPVVHRQGREIAIRWVAHDTLRTFDALLAMNRARGYDEFEQAIRFWDAPMQNILVADTAGTIAIRSTGHLPIRRDGGGAGYRDGSSPGSEWVGRVPFDDLPHVVDPSRGYLTSTNQQPTDGSYPWYMGRDWRSTYRSIRIDTLLSGRDRHDPGQIASFQADVHAVQRDWFVPLLGAAGAVSARAGRLRAMLEAWSGETGVERPEPLVMDVFLGVLDDLVWDEPGFARIRRPTGVVLYRLLTGALEGPWLDRVGTERVETGRDVLAEALELAADSIEAAYGPDPDGWAWGRHHRLILRHVSQTPALRALWRGPVPFPGFESTLSPGAGRTVTHGASWRVVVDFSGERPAGRGIYAGGPSGNPFSRRYDAYVDDFVGFRLNELQTPESPDMLPVRTRLLPDPTYPMPPAP